MLMVMFMKENGLMIRLMEKVVIFTIMVRNTLATGRMTSNMAWERKLGQMELTMRVIMKRERNMEKDY